MHLKSPAVQRMLFLLVMGLFPFISQATLTEGQQDFLAGIEYLKKGDRTSANLIREKLKNHPLLPVYIHQDLIRHLDSTPHLTIEHFINTYEHLAIAQRLSRQWISHLAEQNEWPLFFEQLTDPQQLSTNQQCAFYQAKLNTSTENQFLTDARNLWLSQLNLSEPCKRLEAELLKLDQLPGWILWQKIEDAFKAEQLDIAQTLARHLSRTDRQAVETWVRFHQTPNTLILKLPNTDSAFINRKIFLHSLNRLANLEPQTAQQILQLHQKRYQIHPDEQAVILRTASLRLAIRNDEDAKASLQAYNQNMADQDTLRWQAQIALRQSDWRTLFNTLLQMDNSEQQEAKWQYWQARALQKLNQTTRAEWIFKQLATQRSYYGFLSADHLSQAYNIQSQASASEEQITLVKQKYPALDLIENLLAIGWQVNATREWNHLLNQADQNDLTAIAQVAHDWQHHVFAFRALAQGQQWDQLTLRFPTPYQQPVMQNADKNQLDPAWIYSIMRRESAYQTDIRSSAGAVGLMQLRPSTARYIGRQNGLPRQTYQNLTDAQSNIELGSAYLAYLMNKFDGHIVKATAAYNAGPRRVENWTATIDLLDADQWIDSIPFTETRRYVKAVLEHKIIFGKLLEQKPQRLSHLMQPIKHAE
jgi:soluble lytic murein transglycosylase